MHLVIDFWAERWDSAACTLVIHLTWNMESGEALGALLGTALGDTLCALRWVTEGESLRLERGEALGESLAHRFGNTCARNGLVRHWKICWV